MSFSEYQLDVVYVWGSEYTEFLDKCPYQWDIWGQFSNVFRITEPIIPAGNILRYQLQNLQKNYLMGLDEINRITKTLKHAEKIGEHGESRSQ